mgnify:CR=1 FL=1
MLKYVFGYILLGLAFLAVLVFLMVRWPLQKAGDPNEPAPPAAIM